MKNPITPHETFWQQLQQLVDNSTIVIDRPQELAHPHYPDIIYPLDYGYLDDTTGGDGHGIDLWIGSITGEKQVVAALATVDIVKRDGELKLLLNCTAQEINQIMVFYDDNGMGYYVMQRSS